LSPVENDRVEIGVVARAHGIRGEVLAVPHDPQSETLASIDRVFVGDRAFAVNAARPTNQGYLLALEGIASRNDAETLRGAPLSVARADLDLADDEFLLADLVGCNVIRPDGSPFGTIASLDLVGQTRLVIHDGDLERLVPLVDALVPSIDLERRVVTVDVADDWPSSKR